MLAVALADPTAEVLFRLPETGAYADHRGRVVDALPADGRARTAIGRGIASSACCCTTRSVADRPDLLRGVLEVAAVAVELGRLRVELRLQLAEVESSRARIAQAGYAERRRLERDLHDGAQQRLVTLGIVLRRIQRSLPREAKVLEPELRRGRRRGGGHHRRPAHDRGRRAAAASGRGLGAPRWKTWRAGRRCPSWCRRPESARRPTSRRRRTSSRARR